MASRDAAVTALVEDAGMGDGKRRLALTAAVVTACGTLSACYMGPDPVQYGALAVVGGKAAAVIALCGRSTFDVTVYDNDPADGGYHAWSATVTTPAPAQDVEVEMLGAHLADRPAIIVRGDDVKSFEPGHHYILNASRGGPEGSLAPTVSFTTDDLTRIGDGQVLAPTDYHKSDVVSRESFVKGACARKGPGAG